MTTGKVRVKAFIQARMSSKRYPGKVLAPFRGEPMIRHVLRAVEEVFPLSDIVVLTSTEYSDDPLVHYLQAENFSVFRGPLNNVQERYLCCLHQYPCEWVLRVCADSPLLYSGLLRYVIKQLDRFQGDLLTTIFPRTFPKGQNLELIKSRSLQTFPSEELNENDQEHVTSYFYRNPENYEIQNIESGHPHLAKVSLAVDTLQDMEQLESMTQEAIMQCIPSFILNEATPEFS